MKGLVIFTVVAALIIGGFCFYWFSWKPSAIRSKCDKTAWEAAHISEGYDPYWKKNRIIFDKDAYDWKYEQCLNKNGID